MANCPCCGSEMSEGIQVDPNRAAVTITSSDFLSGTPYMDQQVCGRCFNQISLGKRPDGIAWGRPNWLGFRPTV